MEKQSEKVVLNIHAKMALIKSELAEFEIKRSGKNKHQNFEYLELKDFMPYILKLNAKYGINSVFNRDMEEAELVLYDTESDQKIKFKMPYDYSGIGMLKGIQKDGGADTYARRYMYIRAYDLADNDTIDSADNSKIVEVPKAKTNTAQQIMELESYKSELAKAMNKAEATAVYRKYEGKVSRDDAAKFGAARMNELKAMESAIQIIEEAPAKQPTTGKAPEQKADDLKEVIEEKLETKLVDVEVKNDKPIKGNKNAK